jgi:SNF2 family DNA or RNA helicase
MNQSLTQTQQTFMRKGITLYPHQLAGIEWMLGLERASVGGILADDPGVGKTYQMLTVIMTKISAVSPTLVIVPTSLLSQWKVAAENLLSSGSILVYHGNKRHFRPAPLVITTYGTARTDLKLRAHTWYRLVCDEVHFIRNPKSKTNQALSKYTSRIRWGISGTPLQNSIKDLITLFTFIQGCPLTQGVQTLVKTRLLRRCKGDVFGDKLPCLTVVPVKVVFKTETDREFYHKVSDNIRNNWEVLKASCVSPGQQHLLAFELLLRLRQSAQHPQLVSKGFMKKYRMKFSAPMTSSKHEAFLKVAKKNRAYSQLVFCDFREEITLLERLVSQHGFTSQRYDGSVSIKQRERILADSGQSQTNSFLQRYFPVHLVKQITSYICPEILFVQIKAGSTGLNLQAFNKVHLISPDWNPCNEIQAIARAHRLGQLHPVTVYKYLLEDDEITTIDAKIMARQSVKLRLTTEYLDNSYLETLQTPDAFNFDELLS